MKFTKIILTGFILSINFAPVTSIAKENNIDKSYNTQMQSRDATMNHAVTGYFSSKPISKKYLRTQKMTSTLFIGASVSKGGANGTISYSVSKEVSYRIYEVKYEYVLRVDYYTSMGNFLYSTNYTGVCVGELPEAI